MGVATPRGVAGPQKTAEITYVHNTSTTIGCGGVAGWLSDTVGVAGPKYSRIFCLAVLTV